MITSYTMGPGLYFPIYCGRPNRNCTGQLITRHRTPRHILCRSTLPLCPLHRGRICHYRWLRPLIPIIHRLHPGLNLSKNPFPHHVRRSKYNFLSSALPRPIWNTSTILRLPRRLHNMKYSLLYRILHLTHSGNPNSIHSMRSLCIKTRSINS